MMKLTVAFRNFANASKTILARTPDEKTHLHLAQILRMNGALPPLPLHAFMASTGMLPS
jgi:hypothetical protein